MKVKTSALAPFVKSTTMTRAEARKLPVDDLEKLIASLSRTLSSEKSKLEKKQAQERTATIRKVNALLAENGLQPKDLKKSSTKPKRKAKAKVPTNPKAKTAAAATKGKRTAVKNGRKPSSVPPRYRLEFGGEEHLWSGRGRPPKVFKAYFDDGNSRESCEISA